MTGASSFKVPFGLDPDDSITQVGRAIRGITYRCPQCLAPLTLRAGAVKAKHFSHRGGGSCSYESVLHHAAKLQLHKVVQGWLDGWGMGPVIVLPCEGNTIGFCTSEIHRPLQRERVDGVRLEATVGDFRPDVVLFLGDKAVLGLEVLVSHEVDEAKASGSSHKWIELDANRVLETPYAWRPINHNIGKAGRCEFCLEANFRAMNQAISRLEREAESWVKKAKNPEAARMSLFYSDSWLAKKIQAVVRKEQILAEKRWKRTHSQPAPIPMCDDAEP